MSSPLAEIKMAQDTLEERFSTKIAELEAQVHSSSSTKETVAKVAEELRAFKELMFTLLKMLRLQITEYSNTIDAMETRHRRKALLFLGIAEAEKEDCAAVVLSTIHKMDLKHISGADITVCHRLGAAGNEHHRPILVRFSRLDVRSVVWRAKAKLKGSSVSVRDFLTKQRQSVFSKARLHFPMRDCWTQDGVIVVKTSDGCRHRISTMVDLNSLISKYPKAASNSAGATGVNSKQRK